MGFPVERTQYRLRFEQPELDGLEVTVAAMSVRESFAFDDACAEATTDAAQLRVWVETLGRQLVSWNLEKSPGEPWPMTLEGLWDLDGHLLGAITAGWLQALRPPKPPTDPTGAGPMQGLPMQPLADSSENENEPAG
jgi:hypothetical protein